MWLAYDSVCMGRREFHKIPKFHYLAELVLQARALNPRHQQCYSGESIVGRLMQVWKRSLNGPYENVAQFNVLRKYMLAFEIEACGMLDV